MKTLAKNTRVLVIFFSLLAVLSLSSPLALGQPAQEGLDSLEKKALAGDPDAQLRLGQNLIRTKDSAKNAQGLQWIQKAAEQNLPEAQEELATIYFKGWPAPEDKALAFQWRLKAAEQGLADAQYQLAYAYENGLGAAKDPAQAFKWYLAAAEGEEFYYSPMIVAKAYKNGTGVAKNPAEAVKWWKILAERERDVAFYYLGRAYQTGEGVPKDEAEAIKYFHQGIAIGSALSLAALGEAYEKGLGVPVDLDKAAKCWKKAADSYLSGEDRLAREKNPATACD
ncbi:MAG: sel1 repeat family protein [Deltaproteobacteria bacterium]|jgi:TPR repeat protein|nr:sel1 repeat family protein [Deltaproteobacteria bacterium]